MSAEKKQEPISVSESSDSDNSDVCYVEVQQSFGSGFCRQCDLNLIDVMVYPCTHASVCHACYNKLEQPRKCPVCGARVTTHEMFFLV